MQLLVLGEFRQMRKHCENLRIYFAIQVERLVDLVTVNRIRVHQLSARALLSWVRLLSSANLVALYAVQKLPYVVTTKICRRCKALSTCILVGYFCFVHARAVSCVVLTALFGRLYSLLHLSLMTRVVDTLTNTLASLFLAVLSDPTFVL